MYRNIIVLLICLLIWISGSSYYYVCKIRCDCGNSIQAANKDDQEDNKKDPIEIAVEGDEEIMESVQESTEQIPANQEVEVSEPGLYTFHAEFESGTVPIDDDAMAYFDELKAYLNAYSEAKIKICGHADSKGSEEINMKYSLLRANNVKDYLVIAGIEENRIMIEAKGELEPIASNESEEGRSENRRVEISILK
ncbi:MAG: OmpA family protein [Bacteroidetes bacterium]|nr:OmpA family protein [Bacteroidota bacterium]